MKKYLSLVSFIIILMCSTVFADAISITPYNPIESFLSQGLLILPLVFLVTIFVITLDIIINKISKKDEQFKKNKVLLGNLIFWFLITFIISFTVNKAFYVWHMDYTGGFLDYSNDSTIFSERRIATVFLAIQLLLTIGALLLRFKKKNKKASMIVACIMLVIFIFYINIGNILYTIKHI